MKTANQLATATLLLAPLAAYAQGGAPHIVLYSLGGGFAGGFLGSLLACWFCCRRQRGTVPPTDTKKY